MATALLVAIAPVAACADVAASISVYPANGRPTAITPGLHDDLWFVETDANAIDEITTSGDLVAHVPVPTANSFPASILVGPDGNIWFTEYGGNAIGRLVPSARSITEFPVPDAGPVGLTVGPDGNFWFTATKLHAIGRITPEGAVTTFPLAPDTTPFGIASGPDGNLWFTESATLRNRVGRLTPDGTLTEFDLPVITVDGVVRIDVAPEWIVRGADDNLWFTEAAGAIGRITPNGEIQQFVVTGSTYYWPDTLTVGPDGNIWFGMFNNGEVGRISSDGEIALFPQLAIDAQVAGIAAGPDGRLWTTDPGNHIIAFAPTLTTPIDGGFSGNWYKPDESGHGFSVEVLPDDTLLVQWYVFAPDGGMTWIVASGGIEGNQATLQGYKVAGTGGLFPPYFAPDAVQKQPWGTLRLAFSTCDSGVASWQAVAPGYPSGSFPIRRLTRPDTLACPVGNAVPPSYTTYLALPDSSASPASIAAGVDGALWFTTDHQIGVASTSGFSAFLSQLPPMNPRAITAGADGAMWVTDFDASTIYRVTPDGTATAFGLPFAGDVPEVAHHPNGIALGPDGNLWFTVDGGAPGSAIHGRIGRVTPSGAITEFPIPSGGYPQAIVAGPDGNLWFTEFNRTIGRMTPAGVIDEFSENDLAPGIAPEGLTGIAAAGDGALYFAGETGRVGRITTDGAVSFVPLPDTQARSVQITRGPRGHVWFTESNGAVAKLDSGNAIVEFALPPRAGTQLAGIALGSDGNLWAADRNHQLIVVNAARPVSLGATGNWFDPAQSGHGFSLEVLPGNQLLAEWYVFAPGGGPAWIVASGPISGNSATLQAFQVAGSGARFPPAFDPNATQRVPWGSLTFDFSDCDAAHVSWTSTLPGYGTGTLPLRRLTQPLGIQCL